MTNANILTTDKPVFLSEARPRDDEESVLP
jgi:hypothetical protein